MARKYARIFVRGHCLFREADGFPRAKLEENCELRGTDNVQGKISEHIFAQMAIIVFIILQIFFATLAVLKIGEYINNSRDLARKYARIFVRGHYLFREANSFPRAKLEENCELRGRDNVQGQISEHIFAPNGDYCLYIPQFSKLRALRKRWNIRSSDMFRLIARDRKYLIDYNSVYWFRYS